MGKPSVTSKTLLVRRYISRKHNKYGYVDIDIRGANKTKTTLETTTEPWRGTSCLPYMAIFTEKVDQILKKLTFQVRFGTAMSIHKYLPTVNDRVVKRTDGISKITYQCRQCYIEQTGRAIGY